MNSIQVDIYYSGMVQGVGFRYTVRRIAGRYDVTGFVRNLRDGRVQLVAEGQKAQVDPFLEEVDHSLGGYVRDREIHTSTASGQFASFDIRF